MSTDAKYLKQEPVDPNAPIDPKLADEIFRVSRDAALIPRKGGAGSREESIEIYARVDGASFPLGSINILALRALLQIFLT